MNAVILSGIAWNTSLQRHHNIANWLLKMGYNVYFVEKITSSKFNISKFITFIKSYKNKKNINNPTNGINIISYRFLNPEFITYNKKICKKVLKELPSKIDLLINYLPIETTQYLIEKINYKYLIYDCVRDFENWGGYNNSVKHIQDNIVEKSDLIFTDSYYLTDKLKKQYKNSKIVQLLPLFNNITYSKNNSLPAKISRLVYFGQLGEHIDIKLLKELEKDGYIINIIGDISVELDFKYNYFGFFSDRIDMMKTIINNSDAIIIPYIGNMDGVIPSKIMESLSTLKPVIINSFFDSEKLNDYLYVYKNYNELKEIIENYDLKKHIIKLKKIISFLEKNSSEQQFKIFKDEVNNL